MINNLQSTNGSGVPIDLRFDSRLVGLLPSRSTETPPIPGRQSGKLVPGIGTREVITSGLCIDQEAFGQRRANGVIGRISRVGMTGSIAIKTG